ncbi:hypothetical protein [Natrinema salinisoli]|uniref:hypothetical protein n=1 Tax=Natrinema salinisoli TaxID=2878535 RepID=UPI001CF0A25E|nr:hypothetical protein [Natrinema salinisoli]
MTELSHPVTIHQLIDLAGGIILLAAAYYALQARRSEHEEYRRAYGRAVAQCTALFLILAYTAFVLYPESRAWPVQTGYHLYHFFTELETVPAKADVHLTDYYLVLLRQIGYATGASPSPMPSVLGMVEGGVRSIGLVVYSVVFTLVSLGAQVPSRIVGGVQNALD